jgi:uncharacterized protein (TIGR03663 family)
MERREDDDAAAPETPSEAPAPEERPSAGTAGEETPSEDAPADESAPAPGRVLTAASRVKLWQVLAVVVVLAVLARLAFLGARTAHWDEARVAHWVVHYDEFGHFAYRPIIHGPLVQHVDQVLVSVLGATDFIIRLPVALIGAALPATAYLFREHLDRDEVVAMALFLAANSVMLYYSRFMRSDILVATFMFAGLGMLVRYYDTRRVRYLYAFGALAALGFASKENAVIYVLTWAGAAALLLDVGLHRPHTYRTGLERVRNSRVGRLGHLIVGLLLVPLDGTSALRSRLRTPRASARRYLRTAAHFAGAALVFLAVVVFLFAPRGDGLAGIYLGEVPPGQVTVGTGLWEALGRPLAFPGYAVDVLSYAGWEYVTWFGRGAAASSDSFLDTFVSFFGQYLEVLLLNATAVGVFALFGFLYERYASPRSRNIVMLAGYAGLASIVGYPLGTDVFGAWIVVHTVVPLSVPAAVGVARVYRWGRAAAHRGDPVSAALFAGPALVLAYGVARLLAAGIPISPANPVLDATWLHVGALAVLLVSAGLVARGGRFYADRDTVVTGVVAGLLLLTTLQAGAVGLGSVYGEPTERENVLVQYAQPADDLGPVVDRLAAVAAGNGDGPDLVVYSEAAENSFVREAGEDRYPLAFRPICTNWPETLPLNWYTVSAEATVTCETQQPDVVNPTPTAELLTGEDGPPPMVLAKEGQLDDLDADFAAQYERSVYRIRAYGSEVTVLVHEDWQG